MSPTSWQSVKWKWDIQRHKTCEYDCTRQSREILASLIVKKERFRRCVNRSRKELRSYRSRRQLYFTSKKRSHELQKRRAIVYGIGALISPNFSSRNEGMFVIIARGPSIVILARIPRINLRKNVTIHGGLAMSE